MLIELSWVMYTTRITDSDQQGVFEMVPGIHLFYIPTYLYALDILPIVIINSIPMYWHVNIV